MEEQAKQKTSIYLQPSTLKALKQRAVSMGIRFTVAMEVAIEEWLSAGSERGSVPNPEHAAPNPASAKQAAPPGRNAEWHRLLDVILDHGTPEDVTGIQANLKWGAGAVEGRDLPAGRRRKVSNG